MFDRWSHECFGVDRLPGEPTRDEQRAFYAEAAEIPEPDTRWHEIFGAARYCAIVVRVMNRAVERSEMPADQTIWLQNPATYKPGVRMPDMKLSSEEIDQLVAFLVTLE